MCLYLCMCACSCVCLCACICMCMCVCVYVCMCVCMCVCLRVYCMCVCLSVCLSVHVILWYNYTELVKQHRTIAGSYICYICNMGRSDLPYMYAQARGRMHTYQGKSRLHMLYMVCNTFITIVTTLVG